MAARALTSWTWVLLAAIALAVHGQAVAFGWTGLDDRTLIEDAPPVLARGSVVTAAFTEDVFHETDPALRFYYRPLLTLSFAADEALHGGEPGAGHATNVVLHAGAVLVVRLALLAAGLTPAWSFVLAALFAVHPAFAGVTAWIPGRNESLLALAILPSFLAYRRWRSGAGTGFLLAHLGAWGAALMIKENAIALPAVLLVDEALERRPRFRWGVLAAGWLLVAGVYLAARATVLENPGAWEISDWAASLGTRGALALRYLGIAVIPWDLSVFPADPGGAAWIGTAVLLLGAVAMWRSGGEAARRALFGLVWFAAFLAPSLAVRMGEGKQAFFDARLYVPWVGIAIAAASLAACGTAHLRPRLRAGLATLFVAALVALAASTVIHARDWRDPLAFWSAAARAAPASSWVAVRHGDALAEHGLWDAAARRWEDLRRANPDDRTIDRRLETAYARLGIAPERRAALERAVAADPGNAPAWYWLGVNASFAGDERAAEDAWRRAIAADPAHAGARAQLEGLR